MTIAQSVVALIVVGFSATPMVGQVDTSQAAKSEGAALAWSLGGTLGPVGAGLLIALPSDGAVGIGVGLFLAGSIVGPSLGHFYANHPGQGAVGIAIRTGAGLATLWGIRCGYTEAYCESQPAFAYVGLAVAFVSIIYDVSTAPASARRYNQRRISLSIQSIRGETGPRPVLLARLWF